MKFVINTPNGNIGRVAAHKLLDAGHTLTVISRNPEKVKDITARGAQVVEGSVEDAGVLAEAFAGADAVFWLTPPVYQPGFTAWAKATAQRAADAAGAAGVKRIVVLSSVGAQHPSGAGPVSAIHHVEQIFLGAFKDVVVLRPAFFMENFLRDIPTLKDGVIYSPLATDAPFPMVATRDIGAKVAEALTAPAGGHRFVGIHGPKDITYQQATRILSDALGRPVQHVQVTLEQMRGAMDAQGIPGFVTDLMVEMMGAFLRGDMNPAEPRSAETTTPTTFETFAKEVLAPALKG